ncbi:hypothetical protein INS49_008222 [Diaporthe citri]|uniref:uncharacterized protein n=1 Tax=Diaporthe citri TaxID=83186 RepID=UPI001C7F57BF|nr:uncharacterized protein INS49_008222 [Diaporthe citri]KAG6363127.1 hypothetical protein INS49_008222 [Diaporthe citri]
MVNFGSFFLFATAITALPSLVRRDTAETLANLKGIDNSTRSLTTTVTSWDGSLLGALGIQSAATAVGTQIDNANTAASDEPQASSADSQTIITYVTGTLTPDIQASLTALTNRKADFQSLGITSIVLSTLQSLQSKSAALGTTLVNIASADQKAAAQSAADAINAAFAAAVTAFSS